MDAIQVSVWNRDQSRPDTQLIQGRRFTERLPPGKPQPKNRGGLMEDQATLLPTPHSNMISSCALYIHEILIYNTLIGTQQGSLARTDQSCGSPFRLPGLDAHLCTFDTTIAGETKQSWWLLSTWILLSWGRGSNKERNVALTSEGIIPMHFPFAL